MGQRVKIYYGVFGGEFIGWRLKKALRQAGYTITHDASMADIILAHSAGCFWLPPVSKTQTVILVDPPYWPGRTTHERMQARLKSNRQFRSFGIKTRYWLARNLWGVYYAIFNPRRTFRIFQYLPAYDLPSVIRGRQVVLVRNEHDDWLIPDLVALQQANPGLKIVHLPGDHDDFNYHPAPYVSLLQSL